MRWMLTLLALFGLIVIGMVTAAATGLVNLSSLDPFVGLNAAATRPATGPVIVEEIESEEPVESAASLEALKHPGYEDRVVFLSAADAKLIGPKVSLEDRNPPSRKSKPEKFAVDDKNRLPRVIVRGWAGPEDSAEWTFESPKAGKYVVTFDCLPGGHKGIMSGKFVIAAGKENVEVSVAPASTNRRGSSSFQLIDVGQISLPAGKVTLRITPAEKESGLLSLRSVRLYPG